MNTKTKIAFVLALMCTAQAAMCVTHEDLQKAQAIAAQRKEKLKKHELEFKKFEDEWKKERKNHQRLYDALERASMSERYIDMHNEGRNRMRWSHRQLYKAMKRASMSERYIDMHNEGTNKIIQKYEEGMRKMTQK